MTREIYLYMNPVTHLIKGGMEETISKEKLLWGFELNE